MVATLLIALGVGATGSAAALGSCIYRALRRPREPKVSNQIAEETSLLAPAPETTENIRTSLTRGLPDSSLKVTSREIQHSVTPSIETIKPPVVSPPRLVSLQLETSIAPPVIQEEEKISPAENPTLAQSEVNNSLENEKAENGSVKSNSSVTVTPGLSPESTRNQSPPRTPSQAKSEPLTPKVQSRRNSRVQSKRKNKGKGKNKRKV